MRRQREKQAIWSVVMLSVAVMGAPSRADFIQLWQVGQEDGGWPNEDFIQEDGKANPPPGDPFHPDDDWYFPGSYPDPINDLPTGSPEMASLERGLVPTDNHIRLHFNLPEDLSSLDEFVFSTKPFNLEWGAADPRYGMEVTFNGVTILPFVVYTPDRVKKIVSSEMFTAGGVGAIGGPGGDNVIEIRGTPFDSEGGGDWMGLDFHRLDYQAIPEPATALLLAAGSMLLMPLIRVSTRKKR